MQKKIILVIGHDFSSSDARILRSPDSGHGYAWMLCESEADSNSSYLFLPSFFLPILN